MTLQMSLFDLEDIRNRVAINDVDSVVTLRPYQRESVQRIYDEWDKGATSTLLCLPTGTGKSVCFSAVMSEWVRRNG